jgi:hypothetical protein
VVGDALSWVRQHRSGNIARIGVSVLTKHVELPIKRTIRTTTATLLEIAEAYEKLAALEEAKLTPTLPE